MKETDKSLMPEGFEKMMKPEELTDLLEFLTQKGKYVPLPLDKVATVVSTKDMFFDAGGTTERLIFPDWKPKMFDGRAVRAGRSGEGHGEERGDALRPAGEHPAEDAEVGEPAVQREGEGDPLAERRRRLGGAVQRTREDGVR